MISIDGGKEPGPQHNERQTRLMDEDDDDDMHDTIATMMMFGILSVIVAGIQLEIVCTIC